MSDYKKLHISSHYEVILKSHLLILFINFIYYSLLYILNFATGIEFVEDQVFIFICLLSELKTNSFLRFNENGLLFHIL